MRYLALALALGAVPATAQSLWRTEFGVQGGYVRRDFAGARSAFDRADFYQFPLTDLNDGNLSPGTIFAIIPLDGRLALEPSVTVFFSTPRAISGTTIMLGLRADYSVTRHIYAAAGGAIARVDGAIGSPSERGTLPGVEAAVGYRIRLNSRLRGRIEATALTVTKNAFSGAYNVYGVLVGVSAGAPERASSAAWRSDVWRPALGIQGGYARSTMGTLIQPFSLLTFPSVGAGSILGHNGAQPSALFAIVPVTRRLAIEPTVDLHQIDGGGPACVSDQFGIRVNYGVGAWYGAVGGTLHALKCYPNGPKDLAGVLGAGIAWGYRFALPEELEGRVELGYSATKERRDVPFAVRTISLMLGLMTPLN